MAICKWCNQEMTDKMTVTCQGNKVVEYPNGMKLPSLSDHFSEENGRCHDCNIVHGGKHHPGCDVERCPKCGEQLISCGCLNTEEDEKEIEELESKSFEELRMLAYEDIVQSKSQRRIR